MDKWLTKKLTMMQNAGIEVKMERIAADETYIKEKQ
jgi:hypothetical protein